MTKLDVVLLRDEGNAPVPVRECPACHALVAEDRSGGHDKWHAQMRRA